MVIKSGSERKCYRIHSDEQTSRLPTARGSRSASTAISVLWGSFTSVWWLQKVGKPQRGAFPPPEGGRPPPEGGAHLGHVFRGQVSWWGASLPCGGYKKLGNLRGGRSPPGGGGGPPPEEGAHLGHVFRGQGFTDLFCTFPSSIRGAALESSHPRCQPRHPTR